MSEKTMRMRAGGVVAVALAASAGGQVAEDRQAAQPDLHGGRAVVRYAMVVEDGARLLNLPDVQGLELARLPARRTPRYWRCATKNPLCWDMRIMRH